MVHMDVFNDDAFSAVSMLDALERVDNKPDFLGRLGIFTPFPSRTDFISIEERDGVLALIQTSERGAPLEERTTEKRKIRRFNTNRLAKGDTIKANEIRNLREMGTEDELMIAMAEVARRLDGPTGLVADVEYTWEHMRLGAIQGKVLDADGSTLWDWYSEFGFSAAAAVNFQLQTDATDVRKKCQQVRRAMQRKAKGAWRNGSTRVEALCGDAFFDSLIGHPNVVKTYEGWAAAAELRQNMEFESFPYGGIVFHNYRGSDDESTIAVAENEAKFFPVGAPGVFRVGYSPLESMDFVNTPGRDKYSMVIPDRDRNFDVRVEVYSYPLFICTRPEMLQKAVRA